MKQKVNNQLDKQQVDKLESALVWQANNQLANKQESEELERTLANSNHNLIFQVYLVRKLFKFFFFFFGVMNVKIWFAIYFIKPEWEDLWDPWAFIQEWADLGELDLDSNQIAIYLLRKDLKIN